MPLEKAWSSEFHYTDVMEIHINNALLLAYYRQAKAWLWQPHRRPYTIVGGTFLFVILLIMTKPTGEEKNQPDTAHPIETISIAPQPLDTTLYIYGTVETPNKSNIVSTVTTNVLATPLKEGAMVAPGDILMVLDAFEPELIAKQRRADVQEIEALILAENNRHAAAIKAHEHEKNLFALMNKALERQQTLAKQKLTSDANVDQAKLETEKQALILNSRELDITDHEARLAQLQAKLAKAQALQAQADLDLSRTQIVSPFAGRVAQLHVAPLDRVTPGTPLLDIFDHESLEVRTQIPSKYLPQLHAQLEQNKPILADAKIDGQTVSLELVRLSSEVKTGQGGVDALFKVTRPLPTLALGRPVDLLLSLNNQIPVVAIPYTALYGHDRVYKIIDNRLHGITIERFGERINHLGETELLVTSDELAHNDVLLTSLLPNATTGMLVHHEKD